jgi:hypothetical protein
MMKLQSKIAGRRKAAALLAGVILLGFIPAGGITAEAHGRRGHGGCHGGHYYQENQQYCRPAEVRQPAADGSDWEKWICPREDCPYLEEGFDCHERFSAGCSASPDDCSCYYHHCIGGGCGGY